VYKKTVLFSELHEEDDLKFWGEKIFFSSEEGTEKTRRQNVGAEGSGRAIDGESLWRIGILLLHLGSGERQKE